MRPRCVNCKKLWPHDAVDVVICTFTCTFCAACAVTFLDLVCPKCLSTFQKHLIWPKSFLAE
ncbi:MAG: DUF1272 domain-containing protein [Maribacter sp.]|nr:DUF1272 domain-containing protein [Maribacter sp.]